ncbi:hypothetical protein IQ235_02620, partial [Oscillatoriales cyanobacterium LEGE 11467]
VLHLLERLHHWLEVVDRPTIVAISLAIGFWKTQQQSQKSDPLRRKVIVLQSQHKPQDAKSSTSNTVSARIRATL